MGGRESRAETVSESFSCNSIISSSPVCVCVCAVLNMLLCTVSKCRSWKQLLRTCESRGEPDIS